MRRIGKLMRPRAFKWIAAVDNPAAQVAGFSADPHHLLGAPVVRFQLIVGDAPVLDREIRGQFRAVLLTQRGGEAKLI